MRVERTNKIHFRVGIFFPHKIYFTSHLHTIIIIWNKKIYSSCRRDRNVPNVRNIYFQKHIQPFRYYAIFNHTPSSNLFWNFLASVKVFFFPQLCAIEAMHYIIICEHEGLIKFCYRKSNSPRLSDLVWSEQNFDELKYMNMYSWIDSKTDTYNRIEKYY